MLDAGADPTFVEGGLAYWASLVDNPEPVIDTAEVANRYVDAFRTGNFSQATGLVAADIVRVAPLEGTGERQGLKAIMEDQFAVRFTFDELNVRTGEPSSTTKLSLYTVTTGQIAREEVFYFTPPQSMRPDIT